MVLNELMNLENLIGLQFWLGKFNLLRGEGNKSFIKKVKSGGSPPLFTKQTTKITLQIMLLTKIT